jgi:hypothetical protein
MIPAGAQKGRHIDRWTTGLVTNRAATSMPFRRSYGAMIQYYDALFGGLNVEISPENTLVRRPGWTSSTRLVIPAPHSAFTAAILNGTQFNFLGTSTNVYQFASGVMNSLYTKGTTAQTFFQQVGNVLYFSDGAANLKAWTETNGGFTVQNNGIVAPTVPHHQPISTCMIRLVVRKQLTHGLQIILMWVVLQVPTILLFGPHR